MDAPPKVVLPIWAHIHGTTRAQALQQVESVCPDRFATFVQSCGSTDMMPQACEDGTDCNLKLNQTIAACDGTEMAEGLDTPIKELMESFRTRCMHPCWLKVIES